jgi:dCTP deaminase
VILTGLEIAGRVADGTIVIDPYDPARLNPNSYNLRLHEDLYIYEGCDKTDLDMARPRALERIRIPRYGFTLMPGVLYLGRTVERTKTTDLVPMLEGRSSVGRLGLSVHVTAGFGDIGFDGHWTLEMTVVHPLRIYAGVEVCQVIFHEATGAVTPYAGKYQGAAGVQGSGLWRELVGIVDLRPGGSTQ